MYILPKIINEDLFMLPLLHLADQMLLQHSEN